MVRRAHHEVQQVGLTLSLSKGEAGPTVLPSNGNSDQIRRHEDPFQATATAAAHRRELRAADFREFRPAREVLPPALFEGLREARAKRSAHQFGAGRISPTRSPA
jgi:hypothetical protein